VLESWQEDCDSVTARTAELEAWHTASPLWRSVERLLAMADVPSLRAHKLGPLVVSEEQRAASVGAMLAPALLQRIREAAGGELILLKGPEVAALYPAGGRRFSDVDVLVRDADSVQAALLRAGFVEDEEVVELDDHHHQHPLRLPSIWLGVEVHSAPNWPLGAMAAPPLGEIFDAAVPSVLGIDGVSAPSRAHHALLLAAHAWRHQPLGLLRDLLDVAVLAEGVPRSELDETAERWGIGRVWRTTRAAVDAIFYGGRDPLPLRLWARHLKAVRAETVLEDHLQRWLHPFWERPFVPALRDAATMIRRDVVPAPGETWRERIGQNLDALWHLRAPASSRDRPA
jgi:hypothetical protein